MLEKNQKEIAQQTNIIKGNPTKWTKEKKLEKEKQKFII